MQAYDLFAPTATIEVAAVTEDQALPYVPLEAPGMPAIGPDFTAAAMHLCGESIRELDAACKATKKLKEKQELKARMRDMMSEHLNRLHYYALYDEQFFLAVDQRGRSSSVAFIPGHVWDAHELGPVYGAEVMIVGKCPGREEELSRRNFVGPTSRMFREMLEDMSFTDVGSWYVTNIVRFANPSRTGDSALAAGWIRDCEPLLAAELRLVRPKYLLCLGAEAVRTVLGKGKTLSNTRNRVFELPVPLPEGGVHVVKVMTSTHPAALEYDPEKRDDLVGALNFFYETLYGAGERRDPESDCEHTVLHTLADLERLRDQLLADDRRAFAVDLEWEGDYPGEPNAYIRTIQFSWDWKKAAVIPLASEGGTRYFDGTDDQVRAILEELWRPPEVRLIGHFLSEDFTWLEGYGLTWLAEKMIVPEDDRIESDSSRYGWEKLRDTGPFDTALALHNYRETGEFNLLTQGMRHTTCGAYDATLEDYKTKWCAKNKVKKDELTGYGFVPNEILWPYALYDADITYRLFILANEGTASTPALLDRDAFGNCCRESFWIAMRAQPGFHQAHQTGLLLDRERAELIRQDYNVARDDLLAELRQRLAWPDFNPNSTDHCRTAFFGKEFVQKTDKKTGRIKMIHPQGARLLNLTPYKSTGKRAKLWSQVQSRGWEEDYDPAVDKETLAVLAAEVPEAALLRDIRTVAQVNRSVLHDPKKHKNGDIMFDADGQPTFEKGMLAWVMGDGRIRTHFSQTKETSRASSWSPAMQNLAKRKEADYKRILKVNYRYPIRTIFMAAPGRVLIEADYIAAEVCAAAWMSGDINLLEHARRSCLSEDHPDYYDIHSNIAVKTFKLNCAPTKQALEEAGLGHFRVAAKTRFFGWFYGQGVTAAWRKIREEGVEITIEEVEALTAELYATYPGVAQFFQDAYARVENPGWGCGAFGNYRRFSRADTDQKLADQQREIANSFIQGLVAKAMEMAMGNVMLFQRMNRDIDFKIAMQIHDALIFDCAIADAAHVYNYVIPECMSRQVPVVPCYVDGSPKETGPYYFGVDRAIMLRWGEKLPADFAQAHGLTKAHLAA